MIQLQSTRLYNKAGKEIGALIELAENAINIGDIETQEQDIDDQMYAHAYKDLYPSEELTIYRLS